MPVTLSTVVIALRFAAAGVSAGVVDRAPIRLVCATEVPVMWPAASVITTKSPPNTGRPLYVRSYGTNWVPSSTEMTGRAAYVSPALAYSAAARRATRSWADSAASARDCAGEGFGVAAGAAAPVPGELRPSAANVTSPVTAVASAGLGGRNPMVVSIRDRGRDTDARGAAVRGTLCPCHSGGNGFPVQQGVLEADTGVFPHARRFPARGTPAPQTVTRTKTGNLCENADRPPHPEGRDGRRFCARCCYCFSAMSFSSGSVRCRPPRRTSAASSPPFR